MTYKITAAQDRQVMFSITQTKNWSTMNLVCVLQTGCLACFTILHAYTRRTQSMRDNLAKDDHPEAECLA